MARSLLLLAGAIAGGTTVFLLQPSGSRESAVVLAPPPGVGATSSPAATAPAAGGNGGFSGERVAIYEQAAQATDSFDIESLIDGALASPPSRLRDLRLTALLDRYSELDPPAAFQFARSRRLEQGFLLPLYERWAASDADAAIAELALISPAALQRELALVVLGVIGHDSESVARVAAALPAADRVSFEADALIARAATDPASALRELLALPNEALRSTLLPRIAELAVLHDPQVALAQAGAIDDYAMRRNFRNAVLDAWAGIDPEAVFAWLETAGTADLPESGPVFQLLARTDAERVFALLDSLPPAVRTTALRAAMQDLAENDAVAALARLDSMPPGQERDSLLQTIAQTYGRQNPDLALAWARGLPPAQSQAAVRNVIMGITNVDPDRAVDLVLAELESRPSAATPLPGIVGGFSIGSDLNSIITLITITRPSDFARIADRLAASSNPQVSSMLSPTMSSWAHHNPDEALRWALANVSRLDESAFEQMALGVVQANPDLALAMLDQVPPAQQAKWAEGLAQRFAQTNPARATDLLERFRGQPGYFGVSAAVAQVMARSDPAAAAELMRGAPAGNSDVANASILVARELARRDPTAAAAWASELNDPSVRRQALSQVATAWAETDSTGAERWLRGLNPGQERDQALVSFISSASRAGSFDPRLLDLFSSPQLRQSAVSAAAMRINPTNPQEARRLVDTYITDENARRAIEASLARTSGVGL